MFPQSLNPLVQFLSGCLTCLRNSAQSKTSHLYPSWLWNSQISKDGGMVQTLVKSIIWWRPNSNLQVTCPAPSPLLVLTSLHLYTIISNTKFLMCALKMASVDHFTHPILNFWKSVTIFPMKVAYKIKTIVLGINSKIIFLAFLQVVPEGRGKEST